MQVAEVSIRRARLMKRVREALRRFQGTLANRRSPATRGPDRIIQTRTHCSVRKDGSDCLLRTGGKIASPQLDQLSSELIATSLSTRWRRSCCLRKALQYGCVGGNWEAPHRRY